jgi:hypothetical protein
VNLDVLRELQLRQGNLTLIEEWVAMRRISDTFEKLFAMPLPAEMLSGDNIIPKDLDLKPYGEIQPSDAWPLAYGIAPQKAPPDAMSLMDSLFMRRMDTVLLTSTNSVSTTATSSMHG